MLATSSASFGVIPLLRQTYAENDVEHDEEYFQKDVEDAATHLCGDSIVRQTGNKN